ncbi:MAG: hypothetical protein OXK19_03015 [Candidatus Dadabacteria bacterium]|nr:hypothetical protein [Candidatus Dadabacteria bacterium]
MLKHFLLICLLCIPATVWMLYKPMRVIVPELNGVSCIGEDICTDNALRYEEAIALYEEAYEFVNSSVGIIEKKPRVIFCASQACFQSFGFNKAAAGTVGTSGIVIGPRGWKNYYIRHEMIHHLQTERLGVLKQWRSPPWFKEGMAYSFSQDPRSDLPEVFKEYRLEFEKWFQSVGRENLWQKAGKL